MAIGDHVPAGATRAEQALLAMLQVAVEASPVCITISDLRLEDAPLIFVNRAFCETTGYARDEVIGRNCRFLQGEGTDRNAVALMRDAISRRQPIALELINYKSSGEPFLNRLELAPVRDPTLGIDAYVGVQRDVTAFRAAETSRREREKMEALGRLAAGFSHEPNNLLQPIVIYGRMLSSRLGACDETLSEQITAIVDCASAAADITAKVLRFARSSACTTQAEPAGQRLGDVIRMASRLLPPSVSLSLTGLGDLSSNCSIDPAELLQVFGNLFRNASDAMNGDGLIRVDARMDGEEIVVSVSDTGLGIPPEALSRLFEPFFSTKPPGQGTGLGLATTYGIVRGWGGSITARNQRGGGAEFVLRIPLHGKTEHLEFTDHGSHPAHR